MTSAVSTIGSHLKRLALRTATLPLIRQAYRPALGNTYIIFMLHRFAQPDQSISGHSPQLLRRFLRCIDHNNYPVLGLEELLEGLLSGAELPSGAMCFTVDDGYYDFYETGLDIFAEYNCPVTVFLPTRIIDENSWLWWDKVDYVLRRTKRSRLSVPISGMSPIELPVDIDRERVAQRVAEEVQRLPDERRRKAVDELIRRAGVELPDHPPSHYRLMNWSEVRAAERRGVRFGPHSLTHRILSRCSGTQAFDEIKGSWKRLRRQVRWPVPILAYPQGANWAFGRREEHIVECSGLLGAVSASPRYVLGRGSGWKEGTRWSLPRFALPSSKPAFLQVASGLLRLRRTVGGSELWPGY